MYLFAQFKFWVYTTRKQTYTHVLQCSLVSVGLAQATPNKFGSVENALVMYLPLVLQLGHVAYLQIAIGKCNMYFVNSRYDCSLMAQSVRPS